MYHQVAIFSLDKFVNFSWNFLFSWSHPCGCCNFCWRFFRVWKLCAQQLRNWTPCSPAERQAMAVGFSSKTMCQKCTTVLGSGCWVLGKSKVRFQFQSSFSHAKKDKGILEDKLPPCETQAEIWKPLVRPVDMNYLISKPWIFHLWIPNSLGFLKRPGVLRLEPSKDSVKTQNWGHDTT